MRYLVGILGTVVSLAAAPAFAQLASPITLVPGEAVTVRVRENGSTTTERYKAEWSNFDVYAARYLTGLTPPEAPVPTATPFTSVPDEPKPDPIPPGIVRIRFLSIAGQHSLLVVENGTAQAIRYSAKMSTQNETKPTDVCVVVAGKPSYEHWPHPIDRLDLSDFEFAPLPPGGVPTCK